MPMSFLLQIFSFFGRWLINTTSSIFEILKFTLTVFSRGFLYRKHHPDNKLTKQAIVSQVIFGGVDALFPTFFILSLLVAVSFTAPLILFLQSFNSENEVINLLTQVVALQLSPILTSIVLIARSGSAIAVDIGNMSINHEIKGLESLGVDPYIYLAYPRLIGLAISQITLSVYFSILTMLLGIFFSGIFDSPSNFKYFYILIDAFDISELLIFLFNNTICGITIAAYACFSGLNVKKSVTEVPQATQEAIVKSLLAILFINALFSLL